MNYKDYLTGSDAHDLSYLSTRIVDSTVLSNKNGSIYLVKGAVDIQHKTYRAYRLTVSGFRDHEDMSCEDMNLYPPTLGFCQKGAECFYLTLSPNRQWKQGVTRGQLRFMYSDDQYKKSITIAPSIEDMYMPHHNIYPDLYEAAVMVQDHYKSVPINRKFAIDERFRFIYKNQVVGKFNEDNLQLSLLPEKTYLTQVVQNEGFNV